MKTLLALLTTVSFIAMGTASYAADVGTPSSKTTYEAKDNGGYKVKAKSEVTTPAGTDKAGANMVDVSVEEDGSVQKTIETKAKTDAKGLMNEKEKLNKTAKKDCFFRCLSGFIIFLLHKNASPLRAFRLRPETLVQG